MALAIQYLRRVGLRAVAERASRKPARARRRPRRPILRPISTSPMSAPRRGTGGREKLNPVRAAGGARILNLVGTILPLEAFRWLTSW